MARADKERPEVTVPQPTNSSRRLWQLTTTPSVEDGTAVLLLEGRLGHATAAELATEAGRLIGQDSLNLVVDLSGVDYLSSAALRVIEALAADRSRRGGQLTLRAPSVPARLALELSGLSNLVIGQSA